VTDGGDGADVSGAESSWSRRYKVNLARLDSGHPAQIAEVIGDLVRQEAIRGLSAAEKRMLAKARGMLA